MDKSTKKQWLEMQSLMERMDMHYTKDEAKANIQDKLIKEGLEELNAQGREDVDTNDFFDMVSRMKGGTRASFGYVSMASLEIPQVKKINPETNRLKNYDDWETFGKNIGEEGISGVIKFGTYTMNWRSPRNMAQHYNRDYVEPVNALRDKYGVAHIEKREVPTIKTNDYGIATYAGDREELKGNTYSPQDLGTPNTKSESHYYLIGNDGNILKEVPFETLKQYMKQKGVDGIRAFKELVKNGNATEEEMLKMFDEYGAEVQKMNFRYAQFAHSSFVYIITSVNGQKKRFFNQHLTDCINGININPQQFIALAKKMYQVADETVDMSDLGEFDSEFPDEEEF